MSRLAILLTAGMTALSVAAAPAAQTGDIKLTIVLGPGETSSLRLLVTLENVGSDCVLNLGAMAGNGRVQVPVALRFMLADDLGRPVVELEDSSVGAATGKFDDYIVAMKHGAKYTLPVVLRSKPGRYEITAKFIGRRPELSRNSDIRSMSFWLGTVQSNSLTVRGAVDQASVPKSEDWTLPAGYLVLQSLNIDASKGVAVALVGPVPASKPGVLLLACGTTYRLALEKSPSGWSARILGGTVC